jgi:hypothetical protein
MKSLTFITINLLSICKKLEEHVIMSRNSIIYNILNVCLDTTEEVASLLHPLHSCIFSVSIPHHFRITSASHPHFSPIINMHLLYRSLPSLKLLPPKADFLMGYLLKGLCGNNIAR